MEMEVYGNDFHSAKTNKREERSDPTVLEAEVTKRRYWQKLRQLWAMPQAWEKSSILPKQLVCCDCRITFEFSPGGQRFFASKDWPLPKRCPTRRKARKQKHAPASKYVT